MESTPWYSQKCLHLSYECIFHFVQVPSAPLCRMANLTTATERSSSDPVNRRVTKRRTCSETRAEYYDALSDCRPFVTITERRSALIHFSDQWFLALNSGIYEPRILNIWPAPPSQLRACRNDSAVLVLFALYYKDILTCRSGLWAISEQTTGGSLYHVPERNSLITKKACNCWDITWHAVLRVMTRKIRQSVKLLQDICPFCNVSYLESCGRSQ